MPFGGDNGDPLAELQRLEGDMRQVNAGRGLQVDDEINRNLAQILGETNRAVQVAPGLGADMDTCHPPPEPTPL